MKNHCLGYEGQGTVHSSHLLGIKIVQMGQTMTTTIANSQSPQNNRYGAELIGRESGHVLRRQFECAHQLGQFIRVLA